MVAGVFFQSHHPMPLFQGGFVFNAGWSLYLAETISFLLLLVKAVQRVQLCSDVYVDKYSAQAKHFVKNTNKLPFNMAYINIYYKLFK